VGSHIVFAKKGTRRDDARRGAASAFAKDRSPRNVPSTEARGVSGCIPFSSGFNEPQLALVTGLRLETDNEPRGEMSD